MLSVGSLFSGIGGIELGLERTRGFKTIWHSEVDPYASAILKKRWPKVPNLGDITKVKWEEVEKPDLLCGGFPCQDISYAGKGAGIKEGTRSGLWSYFVEAIRHLRPKFVVVENVAALLNRGLDIVLGDLAKIGYDAEWQLLGACSVGAPHHRHRIFILAYSDEERSFRGGEQHKPIEMEGDGGEVQKEGGAKAIPFESGSKRKDKDVEDSISIRNGERSRAYESERKETKEQTNNFGGRSEKRPSRSTTKTGYWAVEPDVGRVAHGVPFRVDRIKCLGNGVVPQVAERIGRKIKSMIQ